MKIAILAPSASRNGGGLFPIVQALAREFSQREATQVQVFALRDEHYPDDALSWGNVPHQVFDVVGPQSVGYTPQMREALYDFNPDVVHHKGIWRYPSVVGSKWSREKDAVYIVSPQGMLDEWALSNARWKKRLAGYLFENDHLENAACIHALNSAEVSAVRDYGLDNPVCVIPNGVYLPEEPGHAVPSPWTDGLMAPEKKTLLFLGRIHPKKGLPNLLRAWGHVLDGGTLLRDWQLAVVGWSQGGHGEELRAQVEELGIASDVHFTGPYYGDDKDAALRNADAFVLPSQSEGLPMAVLEAWSYRLPVLMSPECNIPEGFVAEGAFRCGPDTSSIVSGLRRLATMSKSERVAMGEQGRALVEKRFTWPRIAEQMRHVYRWMLEGADQPSCVLRTDESTLS